MVLVSWCCDNIALSFWGSTLFRSWLKASSDISCNCNRGKSLLLIAKSNMHWQPGKFSLGGSHRVLSARQEAVTSLTQKLLPTSEHEFLFCFSSVKLAVSWARRTKSDLTDESDTDRRCYKIEFLVVILQTYHCFCLSGWYSLHGIQCRNERCYHQHQYYQWHANCLSTFPEGSRISSF